MTEIDIASDQEHAERGGTAATDQSHAGLIRLSKCSENDQRSSRAKGAAPFIADLQ